jgi:AhpD family alkylhydroperoxidase
MIAKESRARNATKEACMFRIRGRAILLWQLAIGNTVVGGWAAIAPHSWFEHFPLFGRHWLISMGQPYDQHLVQDVAWALLALGFLAAWIATPKRLDPLRGCCLTLLIFGVPHFVYHAFHTGGLSTGDNIVNLAILFGAVAIPAAMLAESYRPRAAIKAESVPEDPRVAPYEPSGPDVVRRGVRRYVRRQYGKDVTPIDVTAHSGPIYRGYLWFEWELEQAKSVDPGLRKLAEVKAASMTGCPFCIDIGSALVRKLGVPERQLLELHMHRESDAFLPAEKVVLDYAEAMSDTPVVVSDEMFAALRAHFDDQQIVELTAAIAWENYRGRFNHALGIGSQGFAAGGACALPANAVQATAPA